MKKFFALAIAVCILMAGCTDTKNRSTGIYMLLDTSGTYAVELKKAQKILDYLLGVLSPGDTLAVARIDTGSFSEKDIVSKDLIILCNTVNNFLVQQITVHYIHSPLT